MYSDVGRNERADILGRTTEEVRGGEAKERSRNAGGRTRRLLSKRQRTGGKLLRLS